MPAQPRAVQRIFGSALTPASNIAVIGSLAAGAPAYSGDVKTIQSLAEFLSGFNAICVGNRSPAVQDMNALFYEITSQLAYLLQSGLPEYDPDTVYFPNNVCRVGSATFTCLNNNITTNPTTDSVNWASGLCKMQAGVTTGGAQVVPIDTAGHILQFNSEITDPFNCFDVGTYKYTAVNRGDYLVSAALQCDNSGGNAATMELSLRAVKNGATLVATGGDSVANPPGSRWYPKIPSLIVTLAVGDTLEFQLAANDTVNAGNLTVSNSAMSITRI
jgi:hypothetical protein